MVCKLSRMIDRSPPRVLRYVLGGNNRNHAHIIKYKSQEYILTLNITASLTCSTPKQCHTLLSHMQSVPKHTTNACPLLTRHRARALAASVARGCSRPTTVTQFTPTALRAVGRALWLLTWYHGGAVSLGHCNHGRLDMYIRPKAART